MLSAIGALALLLVLVNAALFTQNRDAQQQVNARQQYVQQSTALEGLYRDIVKALAELAIKSNDAQLLQMLASQGINVCAIAPTRRSPWTGCASSTTSTSSTTPRSRPPVAAARSS